MEADVVTVKIDEPKKICSPNIKSTVSLFLIFIFVISDFFTNNVLKPASNKVVKGINVTIFGNLLQGLSLVLIYSLIVYLINSDVI